MNAADPSMGRQSAKGASSSRTPADAARGALFGRCARCVGWRASRVWSVPVLGTGLVFGDMLSLTSEPRERQEGLRMIEGHRHATTEEWTMTIRYAMRKGHLSVAKALATGGATFVRDGETLHAPRTWLTSAVASALAPSGEA